MADETKSTADFLNTITEKQEPFKEEPTPEKEEEEVDEIAGEDKPLPFHKDPKIQRFIEKEVSKKMESFKPSAEQSFKREVEDEVNLPSSFIRLVGNDTEEKKQVLKDLSEYFGGLKGEARKEFLAEMQEQEKAQAAEDEAAVNELNTGFEEIEETYGIDLSSRATQGTRAAFVEYIRKISHKNAEGEVDQFADIPAAWEDFQERNQPKPASRAKELASRGMTRSTDATTELPKGRSWRDVDKFFDKLKSNT